MKIRSLSLSKDFFFSLEQVFPSSPPRYVVASEWSLYWWMACWMSVSFVYTRPKRVRELCSRLYDFSRRWRLVGGRRGKKMLRKRDQKKQECKQNWAKWRFLHIGPVTLTRPESIDNEFGTSRPWSSLPRQCASLNFISPSFLHATRCVRSHSLFSTITRRHYPL